MKWWWKITVAVLYLDGLLSLPQGLMYKKVEYVVSIHRFRGKVYSQSNKLPEKTGLCGEWSDLNRVLGQLSCRNVCQRWQSLFRVSFFNGFEKLKTFACLQQIVCRLTFIPSTTAAKILALIHLFKKKKGNLWR